MKSILMSLALVVFSAEAKFMEKEISYKVGDKEMVGVLVEPSGSAVAKRPAVIVVHDWMGITDRTKAKAEDLAKLGYIAFAADIYGRGIRPKDATEAGALAGPLKSDRAAYRERVTAALETLKKQPSVDGKKIAIIGFCFGGTGALELARTGADIRAAVSFHGSPDSPTPADAKNIKGKILVLHGADDPLITPQNLTDYENEMRAAHVDWQLIKYGGAVHSFTDKSAGSDNSKGMAYNENADRRSWKELKEILTEVF